VKAKLTVNVTPADATELEVSIDGATATAGTPVELELAGGKKKVAITVKAKGYSTYRKTVDMVGDLIHEAKLKKSSGSSTGTGTGTGTTKPKKPKKPGHGPSDLLDF
jgi:hypothetical protein